MELLWSEEKSQILLAERGIGFETVVARIAAGGLLAKFAHPNSVRYPNQLILVVDISSYAWCVPCVKEGERYFLKTAFPSRKATKEYLGEKNE